MEKHWDIFVSHATDDKETIARPLSLLLKNYGLNVWYDEFEIKIGDSIVEKITEGLLKSRFGIIILSHSFFKRKWTKLEIHTIVNKMVNEDYKIFPIWHKITREEIQQYSPILADYLGITTEKGTDLIAKEIIERVKSNLTLPNKWTNINTIEKREKTENEQNKILRRLETIETAFQKLKTSEYFKDGIILNLNILYITISNYYQSLDKHKNDVKEDRYLLAAYTIKWLVKLRPIQILNNINIDTKALLANEIFAMLIGLNILDIKIESIPDEYIKKMIYDLRNNEVDTDSLAREFYLLEKLFGNK